MKNLSMSSFDEIYEIVQIQHSKVEKCLEVAREFRDAPRHLVRYLERCESALNDAMFAIDNVAFVLRVKENK